MSIAQVFSERYNQAGTNIADLILDIVNTATQMEVTNPASQSKARIDKFTFSDGSTLSRVMTPQGLLFSATPANPN